MRMLLAFVGLLFLCPCVTAQKKDKVKFGYVSDADRAMTVAPGDSTAEAYTLYDLMDLNFLWNETDGPTLAVNRHRRLKLLQPSSFERADIELYYHTKTESIQKLNAVIHLPTGGTLKLKKSDFVREKYSDDYTVIKFTFPQVSEGAIIEYQYLHNDKYITTPPRYFFQEDIPVRHAEFKALVPVYFNYVVLNSTTGLAVNESEPVKRAYGPQFGGTGYGADRNSVPHTRIRYVMEDQPAFREQPYTNNSQDYLNNVRWQLNEVRYPGQNIQKVLNDWPETVETLKNHDDFGRQFNTKGRSNAMWKEIEPLVNAQTTARGKATVIHNFVQRSIRWNDKYAVFASQTLDKSYDDGAGNSADLNLSLLALLRAAEIEAYPLLVGLRDRGSMVELYPLINQFDHVMVVANLDGTYQILDVGDADRAMGLPRTQALNGRGWLMNEDAPGWIDLTVPSSGQTVMTVLDVHEDGMADVTLQGRQKNYFAQSGRNTLKAMEGKHEGPLVNQIMDVFPDAEVLDIHQKEGADETMDQLSLEASLRVPVGEAMDDYLYVRPQLIPVLNEELADTEQRRFPFDFNYPVRERYIVTVNVPEGYHLEESPEPIKIVTPDQLASCTYVAQATDTGANVRLEFQLDRTFYRAEEYDQVADLFKRVIELQESVLVFRKDTKKK